MIVTLEPEACRAWVMGVPKLPDAFESQCGKCRRVDCLLTPMTATFLIGDMFPKNRLCCLVLRMEEWYTPNSGSRP